MTRRLLVVLLAVLLAVAPQASSPARAADGLDRSCASSLGGTLPVVFVHGWRSDPSAWDDAAQRVLSPSVTPVRFDYRRQNTDWVTDPAIGPALARLIICLGRNSELSGGPGQVVVVGHSMGGLAIRCALQYSCSKVAGAEAYVAQVVTIGTPTQGSFLRAGGRVGNVARMALDVVCEGVRTRSSGRAPALVAQEETQCEGFLSNDAAVAFDVNSTELTDLRADDTDVPVLAIAGDIKLDLAVVLGRFTVAHGDAVVDQRSQQTWSTATGQVDCGRIVLGGSVTDFGYALRDDVDQFSNYKCWHGSETANADAIRLVSDEVTAVNARLPRPDPQRTVRFDGIGDLSLTMDAADLEAAGFSNQGNLYEGMDAACVGYAKPGSPLTASVESATGRVLAINNYAGDDLSTQVGRIHVGSTLAQVRAAFARPGYRVVEKLALDFGQGTNGVVVEGPGGAIGLGLDNASAGAYRAGTATVSYVAGVGTPGNAPTLVEDGC